MARWIDSRFQIWGTLVAESPLCVGGLDGTADTDLSLAINGQGEYYVPGTSLAGALRAGMQTLHISADLINALWGHLDTDRGHASLMIVRDATVSGGSAEWRDGVGIDRAWGTAAQRIKYDRAILPKGSQFQLHLTLEQSLAQEGQAENFKAVLMQLVQALQQGAIRFGAAKTRGLGWVKLTDVQMQEQCLSKREGMLQSLRGQANSVTLPDHPTAVVSKQLAIAITWQPIDPLMVKAEVAGIAVDMLPLVSGVADRLTLVLPGSSVKGALRSQAERIMRTVCGLEVPEAAGNSQRFDDQLQVPLVAELFGTAATKQAPETIMRQMGRLFVEDCYADCSFQPDEWSQLIAATNTTELQTVLEQAHWSHTQSAFHVAIDRWTGGAADGALFSNLEPKPSWQPLQLMLDFDRLDQHQQRSLLMLLLLLLRDLANRQIPLGFATNRGMGTIQVDQIQLTGQILTALIGQPTIAIPNGDFSQLDGDWLHTLNQDWQAWLNTISSDTSAGEA